MDYISVPYCEKIDMVHIVPVPGRHCYHVRPVDPRFVLGQEVQTINSEVGLIIDRGRNCLGNIYRVRLENPKFEKGPIQVDIQEPYLSPTNI